MKNNSEFISKLKQPAEITYGESKRKSMFAPSENSDLLVANEDKENNYQEINHAINVYSNGCN